MSWWCCESLFACGCTEIMPQGEDAPAANRSLALHWPTTTPSGWRRVSPLASHSESREDLSLTTQTTRIKTPKQHHVPNRRHIYQKFQYVSQMAETILRPKQMIQPDITCWLAGGLPWAEYYVAPFHALAVCHCALKYLYMFIIRINCVKSPWSTSEVAKHWSGCTGPVLGARILPSVHAKQLH